MRDYLLRFRFHHKEATRAERYHSLPTLPRLSSVDGGRSRLKRPVMEKKPKRNETKTPKTQPLQKVIGYNKLQLNEDDASRLIGSIVEKGVDDGPSIKPFSPTPTPKPTVLPFPVARHRSDGPHYAPAISKRIIDDGDGSNYHDEDEEEEFVAADRVAALAGPVQRKGKKSLDLSQWRELVPSRDTSSGKRIRESSRAEVRPQPFDREDANAADTRNAKKESTSLNPLSDRTKLFNDDLGSLVERPSVDQMETDLSYTKDLEPMLIDNKMDEDIIVDDAGNSHANLSLVSQIDLENRARLQGMSPGEIAEAQAEIMDKMDPAMLQVLKRRGLDKLKTKKNLSDASLAFSGRSDGTPVQSRSNIEGSSLLENESLLGTTSTESNNSTRGIIPVENKGQSSWNAWCEKVEGVRNLRFSLDGNIVEEGSTLVPETSSTSIWNRQNAENVTERDFLRTEGDPAAAGYTIKEAVALARSVVPGQRSLALHLLASVLDKAMHNVAQHQVGLDLAKATQSNDCSFDWESVWAFALGPELELVLSLRISLDDNHNSVVLACAKVIQCILSCDVNEQFFDNLENIDVYGIDVYTAPIFRSKPEIDVGFLHGGFWKYSAKPSNVLPFGGTSNEETEGKHTIQDDIVVAGQDFAAGLFRMGILPRICYLLEMDTTSILEERLISILVAMARHSPISAKAIMECPRLVETVVNRINAGNNLEISQAKIKSVTLLKVLAKSDRRICIQFVKNDTIRSVTWHLYQPSRSLDQWTMSGKESCRLSAALTVEQLRLWKVCIRYGFCISDFSDIFQYICLWLHPPSIQKLLEVQALEEFASISKEAYLVLGALASRLPDLQLHMHERDRVLGENDDDDSCGAWSWSYVSPVVDLGMKWLMLKSDAQVCELFEQRDGSKNDMKLQDKSTTSLLWVFSSVLQMFYAVLKKLDPRDTSSGRSRPPWLPDFVPKIGLELIRNEFVCSLSSAHSFDSGADQHQGGSFLDKLCSLRLKSTPVGSLASISCLHGLVKVVEILDRLIHSAKSMMPSPPSVDLDLSREGQILEKGILKGCMRELRRSLDIFLKLVASEWHYAQSIETFGRGGPAPGIGAGWGASGGGFWSINVLLAQKDASFLMYVLEIPDVAVHVDQSVSSLTINAALGACLVSGPRDKAVVEKGLDFLLRLPVLRYLYACIQEIAALNSANNLELGEYTEEDFLLVSELLLSHYKYRWLHAKKKATDVGDSNGSVGKAHGSNNSCLETIHENVEVKEPGDDWNHDVLMVEWAHQRLPLPVHWFLSPISMIQVAKLKSHEKSMSEVDLVLESNDSCEVAKAALLFILGLEAMSKTKSTSVSSAVESMPLVWRFHCLSIMLLIGMKVLEDGKSRVLYKSLQDLYGQLLDQARCCSSSFEIGKEHCPIFSLRFQSEVHDSYSTFIETLVDHFGAVSYGDTMYGRQVALYLHRHVEASVRLAAWNALSNSRVLELLPPLEQSLGAPEGYLEPAEDHDGILEAYVQSWTSGALDRAVTRKSLAFTIFLHHISSFLFLNRSADKALLRYKLAKSLLRDYSRKRQHEGFMLDLIRYDNASRTQVMEQEDVAARRFQTLTEACGGNTSLLAEVEKLRSTFLRQTVHG